MLGTIASVVGLIISLITLLTLILKFFKDLAKIKEGMKAQLRSDIEHYYYKNLVTEELREYERKNLDSLYAAYHDGLHGNSFATDLYEQMRNWKIVR